MACHCLRRHYPSKRAQDWAERQHQLEQDFPDAQLWQRAAIRMTDDLLCTLKSKLFDPTPKPADLSEAVAIDGGEIYHVEQMLARLRRIDGAALVDEYRYWRVNHPGMTAAMVRATKDLDRAAERAVRAYLRQTGKGRHGD